MHASIKKIVGRAAVVGGVLILGLFPASAANATVENVGGGTWNYGTGSGCGLLKCAWSHYVHPTNRHSATSICGSANVRVVKEATVWANADTSCGFLQSTAAYWNNNA